MGNLNKLANQAAELSAALPASTGNAQSAWQFDVRAYLESDDWRSELQAAAERIGLKTLPDEDVLISSPVTVSALPARGLLALGKVNEPNLRPAHVADKLKKLRECLYNAAVRLSSKDDPHARFRDIYDLFCLTPGYKKDTPPAAFAQQIYALHRSDVRATRAGRKMELETATGTFKERDVFSVLAEDGRSLRYYIIYFK